MGPSHRNVLGFWRSYWGSEEEAGQAQLESGRSWELSTSERIPSVDVPKDAETMSVQSQRDSESGKEMQTGRAGKQTLLRGERIGVCPGNVLLALPNFHQAGSTESTQRPIKGSETPATPG